MNTLLRNRRRGSSLIEMLLVISLSTVVLAGVAILLTGMLRAKNAMADHRTTMNSVSQFAQQFRSDVHAAQDANLAKIGDSPALQLSQDGKSVEYRLENSSVERTVRKADAIVQRESYRLPEESLVEFEIAPVESGRLVSAAIKIPSVVEIDPDVAPRRELRVEAAIAAAKTEPPVATGTDK